MSYYLTTNPVCRSLSGPDCEGVDTSETMECLEADCPFVCEPDYALGDVMSNCTCEIW